MVRAGCSSTATSRIIAPVDRALAQPTVLYVVNNRGRRTWGGGPFFLERGYVAVSSGWIAQVPVTPDLLRLEAPVAYDPDDAIPVLGTVRAELSTDVAADRLPVGDRNQLAFEPLIMGLPEATLTRRLREQDPREPIPRDRWRLRARYDGFDEGSGLVELDMTLDGGFEPGVIYELTYQARGSVVQGAGFAAIRDLVSFLKHDRSAMNPLRRPDGAPLAERVIGQGRSQSGRALRTFLYEGFNADERGRQVFDGLMPTVAGGGRGFFKPPFRVADPDRDPAPRPPLSGRPLPLYLRRRDRPPSPAGPTGCCAAPGRAGRRPGSCISIHPRSTGTGAARWW